MNIKNFRQAFMDIIYDRGESYYRMGHVLSVTEADGIYTATVKGSDTYRVQIGIDQDGDIDLISCNCPYAYRCKHEVAVLFYIKENMWGKVPLTYTKSSNAVSQMIRSFSEQARRDADVEMSQPVRLEAELSASGKTVRLQMKIGRTRMYVVRDIWQLYRSFLYNEQKTYGKELCFTHDRRYLTEESRALLDIIKYADMASLSSLTSTDGNILDMYLDLNQGKTVRVNDEDCRVLAEDPPLRLRITREENGYRLNIVAPPTYWGSNHTIFYYPKNKLIYTCTPAFKDAVSPLVSVFDRNNNFIFVHDRDMQAFYVTVLSPLRKWITFLGAEQLADITPPSCHATLRLDTPDSHSICADLEFTYDDRTFPAFATKASNPVCDFRKEASLEALALKYFRRGQPGEDHTLMLEGDDKIYAFLTEGIPAFNEKAEVYATDRFRKMTVRPTVSVSVGIRPERSLLALDMDIQNYDLPELVELLNAYRQGRKYYRLRDGSFAPLDAPCLEDMSQLLTALHISDKALLKDKLTVPAYRMLYLDSLSSGEDFRVRRSADFRQAIQDYGQIKERYRESQPPDALTGHLRDYQRYGYQWLKTIRSYGFGGILADDMGLGKTMQAIALILDDKQNRVDFRPCLVVCPSSLTLNWLAEFEKFAPTLKVTAVIGTAAERDAILADIAGTDVLVTSYAALMRDIGKYEDVHFGLYFIDEAQYIKNHTTQSAKAVKVIKSDTRFALTGTPVENSLAELWSIFDFIMPDYLFGYSHFKSTFETPIVKNHDSKATALLGRMTAPFILRRLKKDVLKELPEKTETILAADMTEEQKKLYLANLLLLKHQLETPDGVADNKSRIQVLAMLTKLRQICCDPSLLYEDCRSGSAKLEQCMELMESCIASGHKILLFSQFTSMLDILAERLEGMNLNYLKLTGKTSSKERLALVNQFNADDTPVFLISLKAGGTGLNLTGADIVIHYDPWWNLSAENQASDRAYRIGQKNNVQVYKLIAKGTIEEKIQKLQAAKAELAELVLNPDADITRMSSEEILALLEA